MHALKTQSQDVYDIDGDGVPGLFISLCVRIYRKQLIDLFLRETLQAETFPGRETADTKRACHYSLGAAGRQGVGDTSAHPTPPSVEAGKTEVN